MRKNLFLFFGISLLLFACSEKPKGVLEAYMAVKNAMVKSNLGESTRCINVLAEVINNDSIWNNNVELKNSIFQLQKQTNLLAQRNGFVAVSAQLWEAVKENHPNNKLYLQYCPMKDAYWLSKSKNIENPYYGDEMLECGIVKDSTN
jgi:hypothetical protein